MQLVDFDIDEVRPATPADLEGPAGSKPPEIKKLSQRHHTLARLLAAGQSPGDAALIAGYSSSRVSILLGDPAFKNLVSLYRKGVTDAYNATAEMMGAVTKEALSELLDRLESSPEEFSVADLRKVAADFADRTGNGPTTTHDINITDNLSERLEAARKRALEAKGLMIDAQVVDVTDSASDE